MKKFLALLLAAVICFMFVSCGEKVPTKEELLAVAVEADANDISNESVENIVRAREQYCNKTLLLSGQVVEIKENYIELASSTAVPYRIDVYLPTEEIALIENGQSITVVGTTTDEIIETSEAAFEYTFNYGHYQIPTAYLVKDRLELTGILKNVNNSYAPAFNIQIGNSNYLKLIYFADSVDTSAFEWNQEIKFSAKAIYKNGSWNYYEAEIIE